MLAGMIEAKAFQHVVRPLLTKDGELEKLARCDDQVRPMGIETYGRVGYQGMNSLRDVAASICASCHLAGTQSGGKLLAALRLEIELALAFHIADVTLLSMGYSCGVHALRQRQERE